ncbi:g11964 [Coccomyxa viridis]|uniref:L-dopachrome isomerase n=1 Tax=Coccomyxa viridis TaxID=1274662 RepID=A0ABP1GDW0_9CHLO
MPILKITTNVPTDTVNNSDTLAALSKAMVEGVGKPEQYVLVTVDSGKPMMFAGTEEPAAFGELFSIGAIGGDKNKEISKIIFDVVSSKLGVPSDRMYLSFHDAARSDIGWKGSTFA